MRLHLRGQLTTIRPATDDDIDLLVGWHADPEVSRYWDGETFTHDELRARLRRERVDHWIVEDEGRPAGFIQSWWEDDEPRRGGIDMFLEPDSRGRGLGPDAARTLAQSLLDQGWAHVTVDPYLWNDAAARAWRRAGFVEVDEHPADEEHAAPWRLMRFEPLRSINHLG